MYPGTVAVYENMPSSLISNVFRTTSIRVSFVICIVKHLYPIEN